MGHPFDWTADPCILWATRPTADGPAANNTVRCRYADLRSFCEWLADNGQIDHSPLARLTYKNGPLRSYTRTYGKVQAKRPARRLTHAEAFGQLIPACQDGTLKGLRDEVAFRLGLAGLRIAEITGLTVSDCDTLPDLRWIGKGRKPRRITAGKDLCAAIARLVAALPDQSPNAYLILPMGGGDSKAFSRTRRTVSNQAITIALQQRARAAGLGHVAPHDLRRSAASILHNAKTADGGHLFDLLDIQRVLGHVDPATTMKCYIEQDASVTLDRAALVLE